VPDKRIKENRMSANDEQAILDLLVSRLSAHPEVRKIILFGSRAEGRSREDSDFDLFVITSPGGDGRSRFITYMKEIGSADFSIDLLIADEDEYARKTADGWQLLVDVARNGKILYAA
jgi:predicted nucleotidyltransferase